MEELLFTPSAILNLLTEIDELKYLDIGLYEVNDGSIEIHIGESTYIVSDDNAVDVQVTQEAIDIIDDTNSDNYQSLADSEGLELEDTISVEGGVIKEFAKTLLVGGLVRLTTKLLRK